MTGEWRRETGEWEAALAQDRSPPRGNEANITERLPWYPVNSAQAKKQLTRICGVLDL